MKKIIAVVTTIMAVAAMTTTVFAGTWKQDAKGWWWDNGNGTWPAGTWQWCDGDGNGSAECYYFDKDGYCLLDTTTPDGYKVNKDGAWTEGGVVQTKAVNAKPAPDTAVSTSSTGGAVPASASAVLAGRMNGTYKVTSTIPWTSRWETLIISLADSDGILVDAGWRPYNYSIHLTSAKDGRSTRMTSVDGVSYENTGGQCFRDLWHLKEDPILTFIDSNTFTFDIPDKSVGWIGAGYIYPTVTYTWTRIQ